MAKGRDGWNRRAGGGRHLGRSGCGLLSSGRREQGNTIASLRRGDDQNTSHQHHTHQNRQGQDNQSPFDTVTLIGNRFAAQKAQKLEDSLSEAAHTSTSSIKKSSGKIRLLIA